MTQPGSLKVRAYGKGTLYMAFLVTPGMKLVAYAMIYSIQKSYLRLIVYIASN